MDKRALQILEDVWGYSAFRPPQGDIVSKIIEKNDVLAILPTGTGKSVCFQVPGLVRESLTLVVSPLVSLMKDQVDQLARRGVSADLLTSQQSAVEQRKVLDKTKAAQLQFLYLSPERLQQQAFSDFIQQTKIGLIAIDEAHCISEWGHDFRPAYRHISEFLSRLGHNRPPVAAFTATATVDTAKDIQEKLKLRKPILFTLPSRRENLSLSVIPIHTAHQKHCKLYRILDEHRGTAGICYVRTRSAAERLAAEIRRLRPDIQSAFYHGGMEASRRSYVQDSFVHNDIDVITATNAFGMGVDKPNIRFVIHWQPPPSIEDYVQEVGRAGRDGQPAQCYLLLHPPDFKLIQQITKASQHPRNSKRLQRLLKTFLRPMCLQQQITLYFGHRAGNPCQKCSVCQPNLLNKNAIKITVPALIQQQIPPHLIPTEQTLQKVVLHRNNVTSFRNIPGLGDGMIQLWADKLLDGTINSL